MRDVTTSTQRSHVAAASSRRRNVITPSPWRQRRSSRALLPPSARALCSPRVSFAARSAGLGPTPSRGSVVALCVKPRPIVLRPITGQRPFPLPLCAMRAPQRRARGETELQAARGAPKSPHGARTALLPPPHRPRPGPAQPTAPRLRSAPGRAGPRSALLSRAEPCPAQPGRRGEERDGGQVRLGWEVGRWEPGGSGPLRAFSPRYGGEGW